MAKRYGISDETVRKWRKRGEQAVHNRSSRPKLRTADGEIRKRFLNVAIDR